MASGSRSSPPTSACSTRRARGQSPPPDAGLYSAPLGLSSAAAGRTWRWASQPTFFSAKIDTLTHMPATQADIEARLADVQPGVEVLLFEPASASTMRLVIDAPEGVTLATCERVTNHLRDLLLETGLEVSSPGPERPLTKAEHFRRYIGRRGRLAPEKEGPGPDGRRAPRARKRGAQGPAARRTYTGELMGASDDDVTVAADTGVVSIPYSEIN